MALVPQLYYSDLASMRSAAPFPLVGFDFDRFAQALSFAMVAWGPTVQLQGVCVGTAGGGAIIPLASKLVLAPNPPIVIAGMASAGLLGPLGVSLGTIVGLALPKTITSAGQYAGGAVGVGVGADVSKVTDADEGTLQSILLPLLIAFLGPGPAAPMMAKGLATGISKLLLTTAGAGTVAGVPSLAPGTGTSKSVMV